MFGAVAACRTLLTLPLHPVYRSAAGVPDERQFLSLILTIRQHNNMIKKAVRNPGPLLSHCSAGIAAMNCGCDAAGQPNHWPECRAQNSVTVTPCSQAKQGAVNALQQPVCPMAHGRANATRMSAIDT